MPLPSPQQVRTAIQNANSVADIKLILTLLLDRLEKLHQSLDKDKGETVDDGN